MFFKGVTPIMAIIILISIIIISLFISLSIKPNNFDHSRTRVFITSLASLGIFVTFLFYYSVVDIQQKKQAKIQETSKITDNIQNSFILNIEKYYNQIPQFTSTLLPLLDLKKFNQNLKEIKNSRNHIENVENNQVIKYVLSYQIFSLWQDMIISDEFIAIDHNSLISGALQRANSKPLYDYWEIIKIDFSEKVQNFGELLFRFSSEINEQTPEAYEKKANELIHSKEYRKLFN